MTVYLYGHYKVQKSHKCLTDIQYPPFMLEMNERTFVERQKTASSR